MNKKLFAIFLCALHCAMAHDASQLMWGEWAWGLCGSKLPPKTAWQVASEHLRPIRETLVYHRIYQPYKEALANAKQAYKEAGIHGYVPLRTTYEGLSEREEKRLRGGTTVAATGYRDILLSPRLCERLVSTDPAERAYAEWVLLHEYEHWDKQHLRRGAESANKLEEDRFNLERRDEYEADLAAVRGLSAVKLLVLLSGYKKIWWFNERHSPLHPRIREIIMMIEEELEARRTGWRLPESQSPAARSFFSRNKRRPEMKVPKVQDFFPRNKI